MRIGINAFGCGGVATGLGQCIRALLSEWLKQSPEHEYYLFAPIEECDEYYPQPHASLKRCGQTLKMRGLVDWAYQQWNIPRQCRRYRIDVCVSGVDRRSPFRPACPTLCMVHDFSAFAAAQRYGKMRTIFNKRIVTEGIKRAQYVVCVSDYTRQELDRYVTPIPRHIEVITNGVYIERFQSPQKDVLFELRQKHHFAKSYIFYPARLEHPGKNHVKGLQAFRQLIDQGHDIDWVCAGKPWHGGDVFIRAEIQRLNLQDHVHLLGFVSDEQLAALYHGALALFFPSTFEGFGLPLVEAMASGLPIVASNAGSLPSVMGDAGLSFNPQHSGEMMRQLKRIVTDSALRSQLIHKGREQVQGFSWEQSAQRYLSVLERLPTNRR
jgi:glycosyltransferase involved in cell wall biosynthesis